MQRRPIRTPGVRVGAATEKKPPGTTVRSVDPLIDPTVAMIVVAPILTAVAKPEVFTEALAAEEVHTAVAVRFWVLPSL